MSIFNTQEFLSVKDVHEQVIHNWDWEAAGHQESSGATIVYDKAAAIFSPDDTKRHEDFVAQREEIYHAVFEPSVCQAHDDYVSFWKEVHSGNGKGVVEA